MGACDSSQTAAKASTGSLSGSAVSSINQRKANPVSDLQKTGLASRLPLEEGFGVCGCWVHGSHLIRCFDLGDRTFVL